jgi:WD40 repeat protein
MMRLLFTLALVGCGRLGFTDHPGEVADGALDTTPRARCDWSSGPQLAGPAMLRADLSMTDTEYDPFLVPGDPLTINYAARIGSSGELVTAHRPSTDAPFETPVLRSDLSTPDQEESALALEAGGLHGYYISGVVIYEVARTDVNAPFAVVRPLSELGTAAHFDPWPFGDGLHLAYTEQIAGEQKLWFASRASRSDSWGNLEESPFNSMFASLNVSGATLTADGLTIVFIADSGSSFDIYYANRPSISVAFGAPVTLAAVNTPNGEYESSIRDDGCELFFTRDTGPSTKWDIYSVALR